MERARRSLALFSTLAVLVVGMAVVTMSPASANHIQCGDEITQSTTLHSDVGPCNEGDGLVVTADNITLNLNGHRVFSDMPLPRLGPGGQPVDAVGIYLDDVSNVTVRNGTVHNFSAGVAIDFGGGNTITGITARDNRGACVGEDFSTQAVGTFGDGIVLFSSANNRIRGNTVLRNGPFSGISVVANTEMINRIIPPFPTGNQVVGNNVDDNRSCFADIGIRIEGPGASNNVVSANRVNRSFQEGIGIASVNNINFSGLFSNPPTCQNRGFPNPALPQCPGFTGAAMTPSNDNNIVTGNQVTNNGFGGMNDPPRGGPSPQSASGLAMIVFCQGTQALGAFTVNGQGNVVQGNSSTGNAGSGIDVGGCPPTDLPFFPPSPGFMNNRIFNNLAVRNNRAGCGTLPVRPGCGEGRPTTPEFDLLDTSNAIVCPSTSAATQVICAGLGFPNPPPQPTQFIGVRVVVPGYQQCDNNVWRGNVYGTAFPPCTTIGGRSLTGNQPAPATPTGPSPAAAQAAQGPSQAQQASSTDETPARPLRASSKRH